jgi:hypothetical protein
MPTTETATSTHPSAGAAPGGPWRLLSLGAGAGLAVGALTLLGQRVLAGSGGWFMLVNSAARWLTVAFGVGTRAGGRWRSAAAVGAASRRRSSCSRDEAGDRAHTPRTGCAGPTSCAE